MTDPDSDSDIRIRMATLHDRLPIQACAHESYQTYIDRIGKVPAPMLADFGLQIVSRRVYVAELHRAGNYQFAGYAVHYPVFDHVHLESVAVLPGLQQRGIGKMLIAHAEVAARSCGLGEVQLYTNEAMTENLSLYPALGYEEFKRQQDAGFSRVYFRKRL